MQWSTEPHGGFTKSDKPVLPVISDGPYGFDRSMQPTSGAIRTPSSNWTERMMRMRKEIPEIGWGSFTALSTGSPEILALRYDWRNNAVLFVHNLAAHSCEASLRLQANLTDESDLINLLSDNHSHPDDSGEHHMLLEPYGYRWFRVGCLDYLLTRSDL